MVADDRGLLAMDESFPPCNKRFAELGIPQSNVAAAQQVLYHRAACNRAARCGDIMLRWKALVTQEVSLSASSLRLRMPETNERA
jgi:fructose-bisphosphate aldolase class 1